MLLAVVVATAAGGVLAYQNQSESPDAAAMRSGGACSAPSFHFDDVLAANAVLMDAFYTDVRPALAEWRESRGLPADPMAAFAASGYLPRIADERVGGTQAGWGA